MKKTFYLSAALAVALTATGAAMAQDTTTNSPSNKMQMSDKKNPDGKFMTTLATGGDAFYFPVLKDEAKSAAQEVLASTMLKPEVQVAFNAKKGSLPVRGDVDVGSVNDCTRKGLDILAGLPTAMVIVSHDKALIARLATRGMLLRNGRLGDALMHRHAHMVDGPHIHGLDDDHRH